MSTLTAAITNLRAGAFVIPTETPESDGTAEWDKTTIVVVEAEAGGERGLGYTYADRLAAALVANVLAAELRGMDVAFVGAAWQKMVRAVRNIGRPGMAMMAISAVDIALWDLKARLLGVPFVTLLDRVSDRVPIYGSGGFTSYDEAQLCEQLARFVAEGIPRVKMKIGRDAGADVQRVRAARRAIGAEAQLFVDANGAYTRQQAARQAGRFAEADVCWFEEPVSSDDLEGLAWLRARVPVGMDVAAGEYGSDPWYFGRMLGARAVDVLMADCTRCGGVTGFLRVAALADALQIPLSAHCAPALHGQIACAAPRLRHLEWFYDHVRIERLLFDGALIPQDGELRPDTSRAGLGLVLKREEAARYAV